MAADSKHLQRVLVTSRDGLTRELDEGVDSVVIDCDGVVWNGDALGERGTGLQHAHVVADAQHDGGVLRRRDE